MVNEWPTVENASPTTIKLSGSSYLRGAKAVHYSSNASKESFLFRTMDVDQYDGVFSYKRSEPTDHREKTEVKRCMYVVRALMVYSLGDSPGWGRQERLDLSRRHCTRTCVSGRVPPPPSLENKTRCIFFFKPVVRGHRRG